MCGARAAPRGEECYSIAILLVEALGADAFRERVKIDATDVDEEELAIARYASYTERGIADLPEAYRAKYFDRQAGKWIFRKEYRRNMIFGRHDLLEDAPISRVDLLLCRNTLTYFNQEGQSRIVSRFHFALREGGYLILGRAEMLLNSTGAFVPVDLRHRIFVKLRAADNDRLLAGAGRARVGTRRLAAGCEPPPRDRVRSGPGRADRRGRPGHRSARQHEELETTNEELQSTNEELETMNQELQSTDEEMEAVNDELRRRGIDLGRTNVFLTGILRSVPLGVAVTNEELQVEMWNDVATDMWGLRQDEVRGKSFLGLDIGLPVEQIRRPLMSLRRTPDAPVEIVLDATNRRGRAVKVRVVCAYAGTDTDHGRGLIVVMQDMDRAESASTVM